MQHVIGRPYYSQRGNLGEFLAQVRGVATALFDHTRQPPQQHSPNCRLGLSESPIRTKRFMDKSVSRGMTALVDRCETLAVILKTPTQLPSFSVIRQQHSAFTRSRHVLILAEGKRRHVSKRTNRSAA